MNYAMDTVGGTGMQDAVGAVDTVAVDNVNAIDTVDATYVVNAVDNMLMQFM